MSIQPEQPVPPVEQQALDEVNLPPSQTDLCLRSYRNPVPGPDPADKVTGRMLRCTLVSGHDGEHGQQEAS